MTPAFIFISSQKHLSGYTFVAMRPLVCGNFGEWGTVRLRWTGIFPPATVEKNQVEMIKSHKTRWFYAQVNPQSTVVYPHLANSGRCES